MFLVGHMKTTDGTPLPNDASVQRVCNNHVRQQVYASLRGDFSMQLPSRTDSFVDASGDGDAQLGMGNKALALQGIPRRELANCELRTSVSGFRSASVFLAGMTTLGSSIDVGTIVVERNAKVTGNTVDVRSYNAPNDARKAYAKGLDAEKNGKLANARESFEKAVQIYPRYTNAWFHLGSVLEKDNQKDAARTAYARATTIDTRFLPPYFSLAVMSAEEENWNEVLTFTEHIMSLDPLKQAGAKEYVVELDPMNFGEAYFYNALANFRLNKIDEAEKSAVKAEYHADPRGRFPQVHLLMAEIYYRKGSYATALSEMQSYLELVPQGKDNGQIRERLAKLEKLNTAAPADGKPSSQ